MDTGSVLGEMFEGALESLVVTIPIVVVASIAGLEPSTEAGSAIIIGGAVVGAARQVSRASEISREVREQMEDVRRNPPDREAIEEAIRLSHEAPQDSELERIREQSRIDALKMRDQEKGQ